MKLEVSDLVDTEVFPCLDEVILIKLMTEIGDHIIDVDVIRRTVEKRRTCVNYEPFNDYYEGILQVANMQAFYKSIRQASIPPRRRRSGKNILLSITRWILITVCSIRAMGKA